MIYFVIGGLLAVRMHSEEWQMSKIRVFVGRDIIVSRISGKVDCAAATAALEQGVLAAYSVKSLLFDLRRIECELHDKDVSELATSLTRVAKGRHLRIAVLTSTPAPSSKGDAFARTVRAAGHEVGLFDDVPMLGTWLGLDPAPSLERLNNIHQR